MDFLVNLIINFLISWLAPKMGDATWKMVKEWLRKLRDYPKTLPEDWNDWGGGLY